MLASSDPSSADSTRGTRSPWSWVPTLYFLQGLPYVFVMSLSTVMYKNFGISNTEMALFTGSLYLPWVIKPLWSPLVEMFATKRLWTVATQFVIAAALAGVALTLPLPDFFRMSIAALWVMAFVSASHDIAADGLYLLSLEKHQQAAFVGVRSTFYRLANIFCMGGLVALADQLHKSDGGWVFAWQAVMALLAGSFLLVSAYHWWRLPRPVADRPLPRAERNWPMFFHIFAEFFRKPGLAVILGFLLLYRFPEAQLLKLAVPFLLDSPQVGGLGLTNTELGLAYGTVGLLALTLGGLLGGWAISRVGLKRALWPMVAAMHLPNLVFLAMAWSHPGSLWIVASALAVEQFGYGLGFTAFMMYMVLVADGPHKTAHYSICTGFMALGMMIPGMWSGWLQDHIGYLNFFIWILIATIPSVLMASLIKVPENFGRKEPDA
ncbi:MFS transporter [Mitsuaria sp. CC2]|uniref:MFS transporter n=1 Tax=Mitsuaria sp. CC2 TaxID=3029186 RepID=UPI003B8B4E3E